MRKSVLIVSAITLFSLLLASCGKTNGCDMDSTVSLGSTDAVNWVYENEDLNVSFKLPDNWYYSYSAPDSTGKSYTARWARIGIADSIHSTGNTVISLPEIRKSTKEQGYLLLCILTKNYQDNNIGSTYIIIGISFSEEEDTKKELAQIKRKNRNYNRPDMSKVLESNIMEDLPVGDWYQPYWEITRESGEGGLLSLYNQGCCNLYILASYENEASKKEILDILKNNIKSIK